MRRPQLCTVDRNLFSLYRIVYSSVNITANDPFSFLIYSRAEICAEIRLRSLFAKP